MRNTKLWKCNAWHQIPVYIKQNEDKTSHEIVNLTRIKSLKSRSANIGELDQQGTGYIACINDLSVYCSLFLESLTSDARHI